MQEHSTSSAAHCVLANRPEIVSKSEPKSGVLGQRDGGGDDGRMPIMCGHKVMKILSDSGNSCTLSAPAFDLISKDRRELRVKDRGYRIDVPEPRKWYNTLWSACVSERYEYWSHLIEIWIANPPVAQKDSHLSGCVHTFRGNHWVRAAATITNNKSENTNIRKSEMRKNDNKTEHYFILDFNQFRLMWHVCGPLSVPVPKNPPQGFCNICRQSATLAA